MNHIQKLTEDRQRLTDQVTAMELAIIDFQGHLLSSKFWNDSTIQVRDVLERLEMIKVEGRQAYEEGRQ